MSSVGVFQVSFMAVRRAVVLLVWIASLSASTFSFVNWVRAGCSSLAQDEQAHKSESDIAGENHAAAAILYQQHMQNLELEALKFEQEAARITTLEDPKGFRRDALRLAAQRCRKEAAKYKTLADEHAKRAAAKTK